jgi:hypothetical protein
MIILDEDKNKKKKKKNTICHGGLRIDGHYVLKTSIFK